MRRNEQNMLSKQYLLNQFAGMRFTTPNGKDAYDYLKEIFARPENQERGEEDKLSPEDREWLEGARKDGFFEYSTANRCLNIIDQLAPPPKAKAVGECKWRSPLEVVEPGMYIQSQSLVRSNEHITKTVEVFWYSGDLCVDRVNKWPMQCHGRSFKYFGPIPKES